MFRFTIRELVLLISLIATACGWTLDHQRLGAAKAEARANEQR